MTLCPYKWFLYIASVWALVYVMIEAWIQLRGSSNNNNLNPNDTNNPKLCTSLPHENYADDNDEDSDDELEEEDDKPDEDDYDEYTQDPSSPSRLTRRNRTQTHNALPHTAPLKLFS